MLAVSAAVLVFVFTTVLTIAGVGSAFIVIPTFYWLGIPLTEAMAIGLLLNAVSMSFASANFIVPALVWLGVDPKKASATTAFIVVFSSLAGFFGHAVAGAINWNLLAFAAIGSIAGALLGSWLMHRKLDANQVKKMIGIVLYAIAAKMAWGLL